MDAMNNSTYNSILYYCTKHMYRQRGKWILLILFLVLKTQPAPVPRRLCRFVIKINSISKFVQTNYTILFVCVARLSVCGKQKKNHERNSCNKNQSERREKAPRGAPTGRASGPPPTASLHTYTRYNAPTLPADLAHIFVHAVQFSDRKPFHFKTETIKSSF